mmetsp:Transcript_6742/g.11587  ORF Transcript_6742/g.11587 Transcript_6742/m.11587 type:complete len:134 (+) Transcript_6742:285-686(+)
MLVPMHMVSICNLWQRMYGKLGRALASSASAQTARRGLKEDRLGGTHSVTKAQSSNRLVCVQLFWESSKSCWSAYDPVQDNLLNLAVLSTVRLLAGPQVVKKESSKGKEVKDANPSSSTRIYSHITKHTSSLP